MSFSHRAAPAIAPLLSFVLPFPPSVNRYYRNVGYRTLLSREGRGYRDAVCDLLVGRVGQPLEGLLEVQLDLFPPDARRRDWDNFQKGDAVRRKSETSLQRLRTDYIDILQFHGGDAESLQRAGLIDLLCEFREQKLIRWIGSSSSLPDLPGLIALNVFDTFQIPYSCLSPQHRHLIAQAAATGAGIILRGGIAQGGPDAEIQRPALNEVANRANLDSLLPAGMSRAEFILRDTLTFPGCHTTIVGTCNPAHFEENRQAAAREPLPETLVRQIAERVAIVLDMKTE